MTPYILNRQAQVFLMNVLYFFNTVLLVLTSERTNDAEQTRRSVQSTKVALLSGEDKQVDSNSSCFLAVNWRLELSIQCWKRCIVAGLVCYRFILQ